MDVIKVSQEISKHFCENAVIYADINNTEQFISILNYVENNEDFRQDCINKGLIQEKKFSWDTSAQLFLEKVKMINEE